MGKEKPKEKVIEKDSRKVIFGKTKKKETEDSREVIFENKRIKDKAKDTRKVILGNENQEEQRKKAKIKWPKGNSSEWSRLDEDISALLRSLPASAETRAKSYPNVIYGMCLERFGPSEKEGKK